MTLTRNDLVDLLRLCRQHDAFPLGQKVEQAIRAIDIAADPSLQVFEGEAASQPFEDWRRYAAPEHVVANFRPQAEIPWMLHRPNCSHFEDPAVPKPWSATTHVKITGTRAEVERELGRRALVPCSTCVPENEHIVR